MRHAISFFAFVGLVILTGQGCATSALKTHATIALVASHTLEVTHDSALQTCTILRDSCGFDAACTNAMRADCFAVAEAQDAAVEAVSTYVEAVQIAALAEEGRAIPALALALETATRAWAALGERLRAIGVALPQIGGSL